MAAQVTNGLQKLAVGDKKENGAPANGANGANGDHADSDEEEDDEVEANGAAEGAASGAAKKKKKKKPKKKKTAKTQTEPPRVDISKIFIKKNYPEGEICEYKDDNRYRTTSEEKRAADRLREEGEHFLEEYRRAAEIHRQVRSYAQKMIKPGMGLTDIANMIEDGTRSLCGQSLDLPIPDGNNFAAGVGFPTGLSINHCAAHYSPNAGNKMVVKEDDVLKVDFGVHVNGRICDSAFTMAWNPQYDKLLEAVKDATNTGIREAGIDVRVGEIGGYIQEAMESYEVEIGGKTYPVKSIRNLNGHDIVPWSIHGGKSIPIVKSDDQTKMEEGEIFAVETFGSTGRGLVLDDGEISHYGLRTDAPNVALRVSSSKPLLNCIKKNFGTLPFCRRYLDRLGQDRYLLGLNELVKNGIVEDYPPLVDQKGSYTAQFEHTILLRPTVKEVVSRGDDY